jgi:uncharacterized protein with von Willebrand factor type A (vWA) domain
MTAQVAIGADRGSPLPAGFDVTGRLALDRQCVYRDAYDEAAFRGLLDENPRLRECSRRGKARLRSFPALLSDVFCLFFKLRPSLLDRSLVRPAFQVNRYLIARLAVEPQLKSLRAGTVLDEEAAAAATVSLAERLLRELAATDTAEENLLFELEESIEEGGGERKSPAAVHRKSATASTARDAGAGGGPGCGPLPYDLQQRLEMAEALKSFRSFERLLSLAQTLASRLTSHDPTRRQPTEVYDIGLGNELSRLLPSELLSLRNSPRKREFLRRLLGRQLLTYQITGRESGGPMVVLVDVSHSMSGEKELVSKALAIALSEVAAGRGQPVNAMLFGHRTAPLWRVDFQGRRPQRHQIVALAETFFGGGTDFERPISAAVELLSKRGEGGGQIILISDGLCEVGETWLSGVLAARARRQIRIHTVVVDIEPCSDEAPASFSDRIVRWSELAGPLRASEMGLPSEC